MQRLSYPLFVLIFSLLPSLAVAEEEDLNTQMMRATVKIRHDAAGAVAQDERPTPGTGVTDARAVGEEVDDWEGFGH